MDNLLQYTFFQNALLASLLAAILCGLIGTYIVTRRLVFIAGGLAHASLGGVGLSALLGFSPILGASIFTLISAFGVKISDRQWHLGEDAAVSALWAFGMSVGVMCAFLSPVFLPDLPNYIFGNILLSNHQDILFLGTLTCLTVMVFLCKGPLITALAFDKEYVGTLQASTAFWDNLLLAIIALSVVAVLRSMGIMLAISLLCIPQVTAMLFTRSFSTLCILSIALALISCLAGLFISYHLNIPSGATIIFVAVMIYGVSRTIKAAALRLKIIGAS